MGSSVINRSQTTLAGYRLPLLLLFLVAVGIVAGVAIGLNQWALVGVLCVLPLLLLKPIEVAVGIFVLMIPFDSIASISGQGSGRTLLWFAGAFAGCVLLAVGLVGNRLVRPSRTTLWWTAFVLWGAASFLWAYDPHAVTQRLPTALGLLGLYIAATCFRIRKKELDWLVLMTLLGSLIAALATLYYFSHGVYFEGTRQRASLVFGAGETNPNLLGATFVLPIALAIAHFISVRKWPSRVLMVLLIGTDSLALLVTMSRGAMLALLAAILVLCWRLRADRRIIVVAVLIASMAFAMPSVFFHRLQETAEHGNARLYIWEAGLKAVEHYGLLGAGMDNFHVVYAQFAGTAPTFMGYDRDPHNIYLAIAVDGGILAFALFLFALSSQLNALKRYRNSHPKPQPRVIACEAGLWGILVFGLTGNVLWFKMFWFSWIMVAFALRVALDERESAVERLDLFRPAANFL